MELITGHGGSNHVDAVDVGAFNTCIFGTGKYVFNKANEFAATINSNTNTIRIASGEGINQGRHFRIGNGEIEELQIDNATTGSTRWDLIVARYKKNTSTQIETCELAVVKGSGASDPAYTKGNIITGATQDDFPLYRVKVNGKTIQAVEKMFTVVKDMQSIGDTFSALIDQKIKEDNLKKYPIGKIWISESSTNPGTIVGGTWERYGKGRVLVSQDSADTAFDTAGETGGSKNLQQHTHRMQITDSHSHKPTNVDYNFLTFKGTALHDSVSSVDGTGYRMHKVSETDGEYYRQSKTTTYTLSVDQDTGATGSGGSENLQPYIVVYMFKRIS